MNGELLTIPTITGALRGVPTLKGALSAAPTLTGALSIPVYFNVDIYDSETTVTPSEEAQVLSTRQKTVLCDIEVGPIPENYGRLSWSGHTLTVY